MLEKISDAVQDTLAKILPLSCQLSHLVSTGTTNSLQSTAPNSTLKRSAKFLSDLCFALKHYLFVLQKFQQARFLGNITVPEFNKKTGGIVSFLRDLNAYIAYFLPPKQKTRKHRAHKHKKGQAQGLEAKAHHGEDSSGSDSEDNATTTHDHHASQFVTNSNCEMVLQQIRRCIPLMEDLYAAVQSVSAEAQSAQFWKYYFKERKEVTFNEFCDAYSRSFAQPLPSSYKAVLKNTIVRAKQDTIHLTHFCVFLRMFGPLSDSFTKARSLCTSDGSKAPWMHPTFSRQQANQFLNTSNYQWVIRFSTSRPGQIVVSYCAQRPHVRHVLIHNLAFVSLKFNLPTPIPEEKRTISTMFLHKLSFDMYSLGQSTALTDNHSDLIIVLPKHPSSGSGSTRSEPNKPRSLSIANESTCRDVQFCVHRVIVKARCPSLYRILSAVVLKKHKSLFLKTKTNTKTGNQNNLPIINDPINVLFHLNMYTPNYKVKIKLPLLSSCLFCTPKCFRALFVFIYSGRLPLSFSTVVEIYCLAHHFQMEQVKKMCIKYVTRLTETHWLKLLGEARRLFAVALYSTIMNLITKFAVHVLNSDAFVNLGEVDVIDIIKRDNLNVKSETFVFNRVLAWAKAERKRRIEQNDEIFHKTPLSVIRAQSVPKYPPNLAKSLSEIKRQQGLDISLKSILATVAPHVRFPLMSPEEVFGKVEPTQVVEDALILEAYRFKLLGNRVPKTIRLTPRIPQQVPKRDEQYYSGTQFLQFQSFSSFKTESLRRSYSVIELKAKEAKDQDALKRLTEQNEKKSREVNIDVLHSSEAIIHEPETLLRLASDLGSIRVELLEHADLSVVAAMPKPANPSVKLKQKSLSNSSQIDLKTGHNHNQNQASHFQQQQHLKLNMYTQAQTPMKSNTSPLNNVSKDDIFPVHQCIVCVRCPYFQTMLRSGLKESREKRLYLPNTKANVLDTILGYLYSAKLSITPENVVDVCATSDFFLLPELSAACKRYIRALSPTRLFHALIRSREIFAPELYEICIRRIASEADSTFKSQYFLLLPRDVLKDLLMCDLVNISEVEWGNYQIGEHSSDVIDIKFSASHTYGDTPRKPGGSQLLSSSGKRTASIKPMNRGISTSSDNRGVNQSNSYAHHTRTHSGTTRSAVVGIATLVKYSVNRERVYSDSEIPHSRCAKHSVSTGKFKHHQHTIKLRNVLRGLIKLIRFPSMSPHDIRTVVEPMNVVPTAILAVAYKQNHMMPMFRAQAQQAICHRERSGSKIHDVNRPQRRRKSFANNALHVIAESYRQKPPTIKKIKS